jgi:hypothetical protein
MSQALKGRKHRNQQLWLSLSLSMQPLARASTAGGWIIDSSLGLHGQQLNSTIRSTMIEP